MKFNPNKNLTESILAKIPKKATKIEFENLNALFTLSEKKYLHDLMKLSPKQFGFKGSYFGLQPVPKNLISIKNQQASTNGQKK